jgi:hypothetical protein
MVMEERRLTAGIDHPHPRITSEEAIYSNSSISAVGILPRSISVVLHALDMEQSLSMLAT